MKIELKSNRKHIIQMILPFIFIYAVIIGYMIYGHFMRLFNVFSEPVWFLSSIVIFLLLVVILLICIYKKGKSYIFSQDEIQIYNKGSLIEVIDLNQINSMHYYPFRFHYLITIFFGSLNEGGAWKIHLTRIDGSKYEIGFLSEKEAIMLQKELYMNTLKIIHDKRKY